MKSSPLEEMFAPFVEELQTNKEAMERVISFSQTYDNDLYLFFKNRLGKEMSQPPGLQHLARFQLVDMFTACTHPDVKNIILKQYQDPESSLQVITATVAFGMGIDTSNV